MQCRLSDTTRPCSRGPGASFSSSLLPGRQQRLRSVSPAAMPGMTTLAQAVSGLKLGTSQPSQTLPAAAVHDRLEVVVHEVAALGLLVEPLLGRRRRTPGSPTTSSTWNSSELVTNSRKVLTASRFFEWLEAYQTPPPTLPVTTSLAVPVERGARRRSAPAGTARPSGFWKMRAGVPDRPGDADELVGVLRRRTRR